MVKLKKFGKAAALTLAIASGVGFSGAATAAVVATSVLEITDLKLFNATTGVPLLATDFAFGLLRDEGTNTATLSGFAPVTITGSNPTPSGLLDLGQACVGGPCPAENSFTHTTPPPAGGTQLARADSNLEGDPIVGLSGDITAFGANASTVAEVLLTGNGVGGGDSDLGLLTRFLLTSLVDVDIRMDFFADLYMRAFISPTNALGSSATAKANLTFNITDAATGDTVFEWSPNGLVGGIIGGTELADGGSLNRTMSALLPGDNFVVDAAGSQFYSASTSLVAGTQYQFTIGHVVGADGTQVPEPGTLLLLGAGVLGLGVSRYRKG